MAINFLVTKKTVTFAVNLYINTSAYVRALIYVAGYLKSIAVFGQPVLAVVAVYAIFYVKQ